MMSLNLLFSAAILTFLIVIDLYSLQYPFEVKLFPLVVGIPATIGMLIVAATEIYRLRQTRPKEVLSKKKDGNFMAYALIIAWIAAFLIMIYVLGFFVSIPLFIFLYLKTHGLGWFRSLRLAAGVISVIYCILSLAMQMQLYPGLIYSYFK